MAQSSSAMQRSPEWLDDDALSENSSVETDAVAETKALGRFSLSRIAVPELGRTVD